MRNVVGGAALLMSGPESITRALIKRSEEIADGGAIVAIFVELFFFFSDVGLRKVCSSEGLP